MRIVVDMQGAQARHAKFESACYTTQLARSLLKHAGEHEVILALSGLLEGTVEAIRAQFEGIVPARNVRVWCAPGPIGRTGAQSEGRMRAAQVIREKFLADLNPDVVVVPDLLDGRDSAIVFTIDVLARPMRTVVVLQSLADTKPAAQASSGLQRAQRLQQVRRAEHVMVLPPLDAQSARHALGVAAERVSVLSTCPAVGFEEDALRQDALAIRRLAPDRRAASLRMYRPCHRKKAALPGTARSCYLS